MATIVKTLGQGRETDTSTAAKVLSQAQLGNKYFIALEDHRPMYLMATGVGGVIKCYDCGIKAPLTAPTVANSGTASTNLTADDTAYVAYCFYSSVRKVCSRLSPYATHTIANPAKKLTINGFEAPRDDPFSQDIDSIIICVQMGTANGLMALLPTNKIVVGTVNSVTAYQWASASLTFDTSASTLELGIDMSTLDPYFEIPPAAKFVEVHGERVWYGGQTEYLTLSGTSVTVTNDTSFRGETVSRLRLTGTGIFDDAHLWMSAYANGQYLGEIWDIKYPMEAYLDRNTDADISETTEFYLVGHNDRIWPSTYVLFEGDWPTMFPECVNPISRQILAPALDRGESLMGLKRMKDNLAAIFNNSVVQISGGGEVPDPEPVFTTDYGRIGTTSSRSVCETSSGDLAWVGEEGVTLGNTAGIESLAHGVFCNYLWKGGQWIALADLQNIVMSQSRQYDGLVFGNFTVDGASNFWGLYSFKPQPGFWLFDGQAMTSNILEYIDSNGQGRLIVGDAYNGRVKRILDPTVLTDLPAASDTGAAYTCYWRTGFISRPDGMPFVLSMIRLLGLIFPGSTVTITGTIYHSNYPVRNDADLPSSMTETISFTEAILNAFLDVPLGGYHGRYHSVKLSFSSNSGADGVRALEISRWQVFYGEEIKKR